MTKEKGRSEEGLDEFVDKSIEQMFEVTDRKGRMDFGEDFYLLKREELLEGKVDWLRLKKRHGL